MNKHFSRCRFILKSLASPPAILYFHAPLLIGLTLVDTAVPFATGRFINALAYRQPPCGPFTVLAGLLLLKALLGPFLQRFIATRSRLLERTLQFRVLGATMDLQPSRLADTDNGKIVAKLTRDSYAVGGFVRSLYPRLLQTVVMMFAAGCALFARSWLLALSFMAFFPLAILLFSPFARRFSENASRVRRQGDVSFTALFDFLLTLPLLRTLNGERRFADTPETALEELNGCNDTTDALTIRFGFLIGLLLVVGQVAVLGFAGALAANGTIPVGDVVLYQMLFLAAIQSVQGILALLPEFAALRASADSLAEALERPSPGSGSVRLDGLTDVTFRHVTFAYASTPDRPVIKDFSATFRSGTVVGLSGANGAGKSTLLKLTVNALEPQSGEIRVNGRSFAEIDLDAFRRRIGIVFQDNLLVAGTVRDNITLRDPAFTQEDLDRALAASGFDAVVKRLPDGLETRVGNNLRALSGGERQRLALARAVIRNPLILVLDEASNHLDAESRKTLAECVTRLRAGRLVLIAGHDPELDRLCDVKISCQI